MPRKKITKFKSLDVPIKIIKSENGMRVTLLVNTSNYENMRIESSEYDDVEKCYQELEDALKRIKSHEIQTFVINYLESRDYKGKLGVFKKLHPKY